MENVDNKVQKNIYDSEKLIEWGGWLNEFLWICAGADRKVLRQCPTDYAKYAGIGGTILFTALMAMISGGYALYTVFNSQLLGTIFGVFWGLLIFNLDRFIVNTMYSDGEVTISKQELLCGLPRIIMAIFLGIVISTPLEMKIFEDRINSQIVKDNVVRSNETRAASQNSYNQSSESNLELSRLQQEKKVLSERLHDANEDLRKEAEGSALSGHAGHGPIYKDKEKYRNQCQNALDNWEREHKTQIRNLENSIEQSNVSISKLEDDIKESQEENGFCVRYQAYHNVTSESMGLWLVSFFITMLFIIIETAPTFFKMMIASGPYDDLLRAEMHRVRVLSDKRISDINDEVNTYVQISVEKNKQRLDAELAANSAIMEKIAQAQSELLETAIEKWKQEELEKINQNPSAYIVSSSNNEKG